MLCLSQHVWKALPKMKMCLLLKAISLYLKMLITFVHIRGVFFVVGRFFRISWQRSMRFDNRTSDSLIDGRVMGQSFAWSYPFGCIWSILVCYSVLRLPGSPVCSLTEKGTPPEATPLPASLVGCPPRPGDSSTPEQGPTNLNSTVE